MISAYVPDAEVIQAGALDGVDEETIRASAREGGFNLAVRLKDGTPVEVAHRLVAAGLPAATRTLAAGGCGVIIVACTGDFDAAALRRATGRRPEPTVLLPGEILLGLGGALWAGRLVGVFVPLSEQLPWAAERWLRRGVRPVVAHYPMCHDESSAAARAVETWGEGSSLQVDAIAMDCMGYTEAEAAAVRRRTGLPVLCARGTVGLALRALMD
jgi:hypothetical protein